MHATATTCGSAARHQPAALLRIIAPLCLLLACNGGTEPARPTALAITTSVPASRSSGVDGLVVIVELRDGGGGPIASAGVPVTVAVVGGNATLSGTTSRATDADGKAAFNDLVMSGTAGTYTLTFTSPGLTPVSTTPIALGPGLPATMVVTPSPLSGTVGVPLSTLPSVTVKDASGNGVPGVIVLFAGQGQMTGDSPTTNAAGVATLGGWTLPTTAGQYELQVIAQASPGLAPVHVAVTALAGTPTSITGTGGGQQGMYLDKVPTPLFALVADTYGNPVPGVVVTWGSVKGDGTVIPLNVATDGGGFVRSDYRLGAIPGDNVVRASITPLGLSSDITVEARSISDRFAVSVNHSCALDSAGVAYCWGQNAKGQLGDGTTTNRTVATRIGGHFFSRVSVHNGISCALEQSGLAYCWGSNGWAAIGDGTTTDRSIPTPVAGLAFRELSAGGSVTCAIAAGSNAAYCWGANTHGQLGAGAAATLETCSTSNASSSFPCSTRPIAVEGGRAWESISAGDDHVCAVTTSADLYCWGEGSSFGAPSGNTPSPVLVASGMKFSEVSAGGKHTCGLAQASSAAYCWGIGGFGEVGTGTPSANQTTPTQVLPLALHIDAGQLGTCAVLFDGRAQCWGLNESGAVGDGTTTNRSTPTTVVTALSLTSISASGDHSCGRSTTGQLWCWGNDSEGQLGIGSGSGRASAPQLVRP